MDDPKQRLSGEEIGVIKWFQENGVTNKVIYSPTRLNSHINLITGNYLYFHGSQEVHLIPTEELINRFTYFDLFNQEITDNLIGQQGLIFGQKFKSSWQKDMVMGKIKSILSGKPFSPATLESYTTYDFEPMRQIRQNPKLSEFLGHLRKYHVDYLVYRQRDKNTLYNQVVGQTVFENDGYIIKKVILR